MIFVYFICKLWIECFRFLVKGESRKRGGIVFEGVGGGFFVIRFKLDILGEIMYEVNSLVKRGRGVFLYYIFK